MSLQNDGSRGLRSTIIKCTHTPRPLKNYKGYRRCVRLDFDFSCAYCPFHESDFLVDNGLGAGGVGSFHADHFDPQWAAESESSNAEYGVLRYSCPWCNSFKNGSLPKDPITGSQILDPCKVSWSTHFEIVGDCVIPKAGDLNAEYTAKCLHFDDPRRQKKRRERATTLKASTLAIADNPGLIDKIARQIKRLSSRKTSASRVKLSELTRHKYLLEDQLNRARADLLRLQPIPEDAPKRCGCPRKKRTA